ncbi:polysaccharide deacetylase family protein [Paraburkholderia nemoris]|uniref:polysaccharide deacetylase family protein n=1 Tax=Paraburkholderia nemoris TaxID=2793076 RepID=UPI0038BA8879
MGNPLRSGVLDLQARSWAEYGPKAGVWRLLDVLATKKVAATFYVSGILAERYQEVMKAIVEAGHEICGHSWTQNTVPAYLDREAEIADIRRCTEAIRIASGQRPEGWISPRCTPSASTTELLAQHGYKWHADIFDADLPYRIQVGEQSIIALPFTMEVNDLPMSVRYGNEPAAFTSTLHHTLSKWALIGNPLACMDITVHAHVFGRPAGSIALVEALECVRNASDVAWFSTHAKLAGRCAS